MGLRSDGIWQSADLYRNGRLTFREFLVGLAVGSLLGLIPFSATSTASPMPTETTTGGLRTAGKALRELPETEARASLTANDGRAIMQAFHLCLEAFAAFDVKHAGELHREDLESAMTTMSMGSAAGALKERARHPIPTDALHFLSEERFKELDFDSDGSITFREFLFAMFAWVGLDEGEEDEDEDM